MCQVDLQNRRLLILGAVMGLCVVGGIAAFIYDPTHCEVLWKNVGSNYFTGAGVFSRAEFA